MAEKRAIDNVFPFTGGPISDVPADARPIEDLENLLPAFTGGDGLSPRAGIDSVIQLTPASVTSGGVIYLVTLDDVARTQLVVVQRASDGRIIHICSYSDQEGRTEPLPFSGGFDPDDPSADGEGLPVTEPSEPEASVLPTISFTAGSYTFTGDDEGDPHAVLSAGADVTITVEFWDDQGYFVSYNIFTLVAGVPERIYLPVSVTNPAREVYLYIVDPPTGKSLIHPMDCVWVGKAVGP